MRSALYFAGEVLDLDGWIGGYNFQSAWSTGWLAGRVVTEASRWYTRAASVRIHVDHWSEAEMPNTLPPLVEAELSTIAERMATLLEAVPPREALSALLAFSEKISRRLEQPRKEDPSDVGAPPGAPKPIPVPPEVFAEALRTFDEKEVVAAIQEIRSGGGLKLEQFLPELEKLVPSDSSPR